MTLIHCCPFISSHSTSPEQHQTPFINFIYLVTSLLSFFRYKCEREDFNKHGLVDWYSDW